MPIYEIALHGSNFALNYKEEKHFVKIFANESGVSKKHFSIVEVISWILFLIEFRHGFVYYEQSHLNNAIVMYFLRNLELHVYLNLS